VEKEFLFLPQRIVSRKDTKVQRRKEKRIKTLRLIFFAALRGKRILFLPQRAQREEHKGTQRKRL